MLLFPGRAGSLRLCTDFLIAVCELLVVVTSLVAEHGLYGSVVAAHGLSYPLARGIF